jgi:hypothetical protein
MSNRQVELRFQNHIIDSYAAQKGHACKWASEWQKGKPDLICAIPSFPMHLLEVKHLPDFGPGAKHDRVLNALEPKQRSEAKKYLEGGGVVFAAVIGCSDKAIGSKLGLFHTGVIGWFASDAWWADYRPGIGYDMTEALRRIVYKWKT